MKILFILEYYYPNIGGVEKLFKSLTENLVSQGHSVEVVTTRFEKNLSKTETINGVNIRRLKLSNRFTFTFLSIFFMISNVRKCDIIHTTSYNAAFPAWLASKIFRKKTVITFHEVWGPLWRELPYLNKVQRFLFSSYESFILKLRFNLYIAVSDFTSKKLVDAGIPKDKIVKIYNGIDYDQYKTEQGDLASSFTFTFFGRLGVSKGLDLIIPTAKQFILKHPQSIFKLIIPKTPKAFYNRIIKDIRNLDLDDHIELMHQLSFDELKEEISKSHCILIPSYSEGFCFAAVETSALDVPVISSGKGALKETTLGRHIFMDTFNQEGLYNALERAYKNDFDYFDPKRFNLNSSIEAYLKMYKKL